MSNCKHCEFIEKTFGKVLKCEDSTNREYWLMTEVFVYLHGSDICGAASTMWDEKTKSFIPLLEMREKCG